MTAKSATVAPEAKLYKYYGIEYRMPVQEMASQANVSVRTIKTFLKLKAMGYQPHIDAGWTAAQCYADAGLAKRKPAPTKADVDDFKTVIIYLRGQLHDGEDEINRLRGMLFGLGVDPDGFGDPCPPENRPPRATCW